MEVPYAMEMPPLTDPINFRAHALERKPEALFLTDGKIRVIRLNFKC